MTMMMNSSSSSNSSSSNEDGISSSNSNNNNKPQQNNYKLQKAADCYQPGICLYEGTPIFILLLVKQKV